MTIRRMFQKALDRPINGVVKADQSDNDTVFQELDEYVVTNELDRHFRAFFESYSTELSDPSIAGRVGIWISGFFGSGKSHFLKILSYILSNQTASNADGQVQSAIEFFDEEKIRDAMIRGDMAKAVQNPADVILFNIDSKASSADDGNKILNVFLSVFNEHLGFSANHPHIAHMERHLVEKQAYEAFLQSFKQHSGLEWHDERDGYHFYQDALENALSDALGLSQEAAQKWFNDSEDTFKVSVELFCQWVWQYLNTCDPEHRVLFLVDEVGQFIGQDTSLMLTLQTITENLGTICNGQAWIIVTSQADIDAVLGNMPGAAANDFSKIAGRFKTRLSLSSSNTDEVIQRRLLQKTADAEKELNAVYAEKGDILRNQLSFDRSGPTLKNFDSAEAFAKNYPFAPYHFQLVQKVFEAIRKVGASGAHLAYGERSMLDAFQVAANAVSDQEIGALVPMHRFYDSIEGFLDPAVKKTVDNAGDNVSLDPADINVLRTLFMIRYVDLVKGTLDNLVTLSIEQIDEDKIALRERVEASLQRLERETLVTRNGDEFLFLTNEERDVTRQIKAMDLPSSEEIKHLGNLIFKDTLRDQVKYRHAANGADYSISRYLDAHSVDGRHENDLRLEFITPLDPDYQLYSAARCIGKSADSNGCALFKLPDDPSFFDEMRTWLKTAEFIRLNSDESQPEVASILAERARENQLRRQRITAVLEDLINNAEAYACGQSLDLQASNITAKVNEACQYLLENTFTKLTYLTSFAENTPREINAVLSADDVGQVTIDMNDELGNPRATAEVDQYITLRAGSDERVLVTDILERFAKRPYGWPEAEILLIVARLTAASKISLLRSGGSLLPRDAIEPLQNTRSRREISILPKRQTDPGNVKAAQEFSKDLFQALGPSTEKELFDFYRDALDQWQTNLIQWKSQAEAGSFPGLNLIEIAQRHIETALQNGDSFDFFASLLNNKSTWLDLEEDYADLKGFYSHQISTWRQLQTALREFEPNSQALEKTAEVSQALTELREIQSDSSPFGRLNKIPELISTVSAANEQELSVRLAHAEERIQVRIQEVQSELERSGVSTPDLSNSLLMPLQQLKQSLTGTTSIAEIYRLQGEVAEELQEEALLSLDAAVRNAAETKTSGDDTTPIPPPKPVVEINASSVVAEHVSGLYVETEADVAAATDALKKSLLDAIANNKRVRLR